MKKLSRFWTPIFIRNGNLLTFTSSAFIAESEDVAQALGATVGPGIAALTGAEFSGEAICVENGHGYVFGKLSGHDIAILSGPLFDSVLRDQAKRGAFAAA